MKNMTIKIKSGPLKELLCTMLDNYDKKHALKAYTLDNRKWYSADTLCLINDDLELLSENGLIKLGAQMFSKYKNIKLIESRIPDLIDVLKWERKDDLNDTQTILKKHMDDCEETKRLCEYFLQSEYKSNNLEKLDISLNLYTKVMMNDKDMFIRRFSQENLSNTKKFQKVYMDTIVGWIMLMFPELPYEDDNKDALLEQWNIYKNPIILNMKGNAVITMNKGGKKTCIDLTNFPTGFCIYVQDIDNIESLEIFNENIITIENLTSFHQFNKEGFFCFYTGGYTNKYSEKFISRFLNCGKNVWHFGDIDWGGFQILINLRKKTNISFKPYCMSINELKKYSEYVMDLVSGEIKKLQNIKQITHEFDEVIDYMCEHNIKLEQEIIEV